MDEPREGMNLRLPLALKEQVRELARENHRTLTKEIEHALTHYVATPATPAPAEAG